MAMKQQHDDLGVDFDLTSKQQQQHADIAMDSDMLPLPEQLPLSHNLTKDSDDMTLSIFFDIYFDRCR
jgi:hypothetical protein